MGDERGASGGPVGWYRPALVHSPHRSGVLLSAFIALLIGASGWNQLDLPLQTVQAVGGTTEQRETLERALTLFQRAGLDLPLVRVELSKEEAECNASRGGFRRMWPRNRVVVCTDRVEVMVHELAHAWVYRNLDRSERIAFTQLRGASTWSSTAFPWRERATEHAAEILTWSLVRFPSWQLRVSPSDPDSLHAALDFLRAAAASPRPYRHLVL